MQSHFHGPDNAEYEIRKAYNTAVESAVTFAGFREPIPGLNPVEVSVFYRKAFRCLQEGERLAAERWARTTKHLARAFWHEAKVAHLEAHATEFAFLPGATSEEYNLHEHPDTTEDLLNCLADHSPPGAEAMPEDMRRYLTRAREHLEILRHSNYTHELLRAERLKAAHEYGRVIECMVLALETDQTSPRAA